MMRLKLAFRNVFRNQRRSLINILMLAGGVSAILLFRGFCDKILIDLREVTIRSQTGHIQIASRTFWEKSERTPREALMPEYKNLLIQLKSIPGVKSATGRLSFFGLLGKGDQSLGARGVSFDPETEAEKVRAMNVVEGSIPDPKLPFHIVLGSGLAKKIRAKVGDSLTVLGHTYDGVVNALDLEVGAIVNTSISDFDDTTFLLPLSTAQKLLDTDKVEQIILWLDKTELTPLIKQEIDPQLAPFGGSVISKSWEEVAFYYLKAVKFFTIQNRVIEIIVLVLVLLGIMNTVGMSVFERVAEIGTVRALGDREGSIIRQFVLEGSILGVIGACIGAGLGVILAQAIRALKIQFEVPGASVPLKVGMKLVAENFVGAILIVILAAVIASFIPAFKASRINISEALRRGV